MSVAETPVPARLHIRYRFLRTNREIRLGVAILMFILILGVVLPGITGYSSSEFVARPLSSPSLAHPFGTDRFGRDVMVRSFSAAWVDYLIAAVAVGVAALVGSVVGVFAGATDRRHADWILMRVVDAIIAFPFAYYMARLAKPRHRGRVDGLEAAKGLCHIAGFKEHGLLPL
jgi:peptide/nickel transport system permease protein